MQDAQNQYNPPSCAPSERPPRLVIDHGITRRAVSASEPLCISGSRAELEEIARAILDHCQQDKLGANLGYVWIQFGPQENLRRLLNTVPTHWDILGWQAIGDGTARHHGAACVRGVIGSSVALRDGTKVTIARGSNADNANVWLEVKPLLAIEAAHEASPQAEPASEFDAPHRGTGPGFQ